MKPTAMCRPKSTWAALLSLPHGLAFAALLAALGMAPPAAAVDLSGVYIITTPLPCRLTVVQTGTATRTTGSCLLDSTSFPLSLDGTVDPSTGAGTLSGAIPGLCADLFCSLTGDGEEIHSTCTSITPACNGPLVATKCGNGVIDPLENCEDGNQADGDCCSARCRLDPVGTVCTTDGNDCTADVCNATGTCTHLPRSGPCDDGNPCSVGDACNAGACVPGSPAPAGTACTSSTGTVLCTDNVCDAGGTCTRVPMSPEACRKATACHSTCTQDLAACKQTCPVHGTARRDCREACAQRSTCTAPGTRIRTMAYLVSECTTDPQRRSSLRQKLLIRRGNCDPVTVMEVATPTPVPDLGADLPRYYGPYAFKDGVCAAMGRSREAAAVIAFGLNGTIQQRTFGVFQALTVLPNGSGVVFEVSKRWKPLVPGLPPDTPDEGIFFVRSDGSHLRKLGDASQLQLVYGSHEWSASPDSRRIAFIDNGPDDSGTVEPQVWLLNLPDGTRQQLTSQSRPPAYEAYDSTVLAPAFLNRRTIGFYSGRLDSLDPATQFTAYQVKLRGRKQITTHVPAIPVAGGGGHVVTAFSVTGKHPSGALGFLTDRRSKDLPGVYAPRELFMVDGKEVVQLSNFGRSDTNPGGGHWQGALLDGHFFFLASANTPSKDHPEGENPYEICQMFSVAIGGEPRQVTHFRANTRSVGGCREAGAFSGCGITWTSPSVDRVTHTVVFSSNCDPFGTNPYGEQIYAMRPDGSGLRQLTSARGMTTDPDGILHVELAGPFAYQ